MGSARRATICFEAQSLVFSIFAKRVAIFLVREMFLAAGARCTAGTEDDDDDSSPGRIRTWILALFLTGLAVLATACLCGHLERVDPGKRSRLLAWPETFVLKHSSANHSMGASIVPRASIVTRAKKVYRAVLFVPLMACC